MLSMDDELYDRAIAIHTTFIPFREYARLLNIHDIGRKKMRHYYQYCRNTLTLVNNIMGKTNLVLITVDDMYKNS